MGKKNAADVNKEAFWLGDSSAGVALSLSAKNDTSSKAPLLYRRLQAQAQMDVAPVSPPLSHRKFAVVTPQATSPPSTPRKCFAFVTYQAGLPLLGSPLEFIPP